MLFCRTVFAACQKHLYYNPNPAGCKEKTAGRARGRKNATILATVPFDAGNFEYIKEQHIPRKHTDQYLNVVA